MALELIDKFPDLARSNHPVTGTALQVIALKYTTFLVEARLNFWERLACSGEVFFFAILDMYLYHYRFCICLHILKVLQLQIKVHLVI